MRDYAEFPPLIVTGARGVRLRLDDGREVLDAISSWWCKALGHGHPRLAAALRAQQDAFEHVITANTTSAPLVRFCERLLAAANGLPPAAWGPAAPPGRRAGSLRQGVPGRQRIDRRRDRAEDGAAGAGAARGAAAHALRRARERATTARRRARSRSAISICTRRRIDRCASRRGRLTGLPYRSGPADPAWLDAGAEWPAIEAALDAQADDAGRDRLRTGAAGGGRHAVLQPRSAAPVARLGRRARRLSDRRRDRRRDGAAGRDPREPPGRRAGPDLAPPRCPTSRCCRRG